MAIKCNTIKWLEDEFRKLLNKKQEVVYRITESPCWYNIQIEYDGGGQIAYYQTGNWSEIVEFCESHCNPGYDLMNGLGCTEPELAEATTNYIHSLWKKMRYE